MGQVCTNDFTTLGMNGIRHAVMCNEKGQILTDGVVIRIGEDRYRTYWLDPVISYYVKTRPGRKLSFTNRTRRSTAPFVNGCLGLHSFVSNPRFPINNS